MRRRFLSRRPFQTDARKIPHGRLWQFIQAEDIFRALGVPLGRQAHRGPHDVPLGLLSPPGRATQVVPGRG